MVKESANFFSKQVVISVGGVSRLEAMVDGVIKIVSVDDERTVPQVAVAQDILIFVDVGG